MKCTLLLLALTAPVPVKEKIALPQGPPPTWGLATMKEGKLNVQQSVMVPRYRTETRVRTETRNGRKFQVPYQVTVASYRMFQQIVTVPQPQFFDTAGKKIGTARAAKLLDKPRVVLLSADGKAIDPFYLRTVRDNTIIVARSVTSPQFTPDRPPRLFPGKPGLPPPPPPPKPKT